MKQTLNKPNVALIYVILALATFIAYEPLRHNEFVDYDDDFYITENPHINSGLTPESVVWAFTTPHQYMWHPLTSLSHMLDCQLFGLESFWHHLTNLLFHVASTLLLFGILKRMTGTVWQSVFIAAAFALHPLNVESVAWAAERKNVLSGFFWMLTIAAYIRYAERPRIGRYLLVVLALCLGLMAKPTVVTLPFVLLLLDYWPLGRLQWGRQSRVEDLPQSELAKANCKRSSAWRLIREKIPLFILAAALSVITFIAQQKGGVVVRIESLPIYTRIANALVSYTSYIGKMIYPSRLAVLYPYPKTLRIDGAVILLVVISVLVIRWRQRRPWLTVGWLWYLGTLVPVIGLVQSSAQAMADRYAYLPSIGIFIMVAWGVAELVTKWRYRKIGLGISAGLALSILLICTRMQVRHWQNSSTLYEHTIAVTENNPITHYNYGVVLCEKGELNKAIQHFKEALRMNQADFRAQNNLGEIYYSQGQIKQALACWNKVLKFEPERSNIINNLAWVKATQKNPDFRNPEEAVQLALIACNLTRYNRPEFLDTLAVAYAAAGRFSQAIETAEKAINLAEASGEENLVQEIQKHLELYKARQPYHEK